MSGEQSSQAADFECLPGARGGARGLWGGDLFVEEQKGKEKAERVFSVGGARGEGGLFKIKGKVDDPGP